MIDFAALKRRYLPVKLRSGLVINIEAPKAKVYNVILSVTKASNEKDEVYLLKSLAKVTSMCLSKNKEGKTFDENWVENNMTFEEMIMLINGVIEWTNKEKPKN